MIKNNVLLLFTTIITISMLSATPLANLAFAEIPDLCTIGSSAIGASVNPDTKAKDGDIININVQTTNTSGSGPGRHKPPTANHSDR